MKFNDIQHIVILIIAFTFVTLRLARGMKRAECALNERGPLSTKEVVLVTTGAVAFMLLKRWLINT